MEARTLIDLITRFETASVGCRTLTGAMVKAFGVNYNKVPEFLQVEKYVASCMQYDDVTGEWY